MVEAVGMTASIAPVEERSTETVEELELDVPWITLVWNDPVNLMSYVTYVFETYFGYPRPKAEKLMLDVHTKGKAVVAHGNREEMERDTEAMHGYGLWATFEKDA
jgi:ATP-dependent Clp protease adaptor protein ClpS